MKKRVYLDTCVWCRPFDEHSQRVEEESEAFFKILQKIGEGEIVVVGSVMLDEEIEEIEEEWKKEAVKSLLYLAVTEEVTWVSEPKEEEIKETVKLKEADAFHVSCAIEGGCEYFISVDDEILKRGGEIERQYGIKVCCPAEFLGGENENRS